MNELDGRFTKLSFFASALLTSVDLFTQVSVSLTGMCVMSFVSSLNGPASVFGLGLPLPAFLFDLGELWRDSVLAANPLCLVVRLGGVLWSEVGGGVVVLYRAGGGYCCNLGQLSRLQVGMRSISQAVAVAKDGPGIYCFDGRDIPFGRNHPGHY